MASTYATPMRGHDAEWLLQIVMAENDRAVRVGQKGIGKDLRDSRLLSVGAVHELDQDEIDAARRLISRVCRRRGPGEVTEILSALGLDDRGGGPLRTCQGCKKRAPSSEFGDRGDGQDRCAACCTLRPASPLPQEVKRCRRCKVAKPLSAYHRSSASGDGLQSRCKACRTASERGQDRQRARTSPVEAP